MLANLMNLAIYMQITSGVTRVELSILTNCSQIGQNKFTNFMESSIFFPRSKSLLSKQNTSLKSGTPRSGTDFSSIFFLRSKNVLPKQKTSIVQSF